MTKPRFALVPHGGYPFDVLFCIGATHEQVCDRVQRGYPETLTAKDRKNLRRNGRGYAVMMPHGQTIVQLEKFDHAVLAHEIFHAVTLLMQRIGVRHSGDSDEAYAYAIEHLTREALRKLKR